MEKCRFLVQDGHFLVLGGSGKALVMFWNPGEEPEASNSCGDVGKPTNVSKLPLISLFFTKDWAKITLSHSAGLINIYQKCHNRYWHCHYKLFWVDFLRLLTISCWYLTRYSWQNWCIAAVSGLQAPLSAHAFSVLTTNFLYQAEIGVLWRPPQYLDFEVLKPFCHNFQSITRKESHEDISKWHLNKSVRTLNLRHQKTKNLAEKW